MSKKKKLKVAIIGLTSCEGCQFALLDQGKKFLNWLKEVEVEEFRLLEDEPMTDVDYDICFVEGNPITRENIKFLKEMRSKSKLLVVLGNCAALGGVWELKNYQLKNKTIRQVYKKNKKVENPDIKEVYNFVKVDFTIPGCPIDGEEVMEILYCLLEGKIPRLPQNPVCYECQKLGYDCLLQKGKICLGPITLAGCKAICLKSKQACWGCRGLFEGAKIDNFLKFLKTKFTVNDINRVMEVFGLRDHIIEESHKNKKKNIKTKK